MSSEEQLSDAKSCPWFKRKKKKKKIKKSYNQKLRY